MAVPVKRVEDPRFITGHGSYTDDIKLPGMAYMAILRSPYAHARIKRIDTARAKQHPGVYAVFTGADLHDKVGPIPCAWLIPDSDLKLPPYRALCSRHRPLHRRRGGRRRGEQPVYRA